MTKRKTKDSAKVRAARDKIAKYHDPPHVDLSKTLDALEDLWKIVKKKEDKAERGKKK